MGSRGQREVRQQKELVEEMKRIAAKVGKSVAEIVPWTEFEEAEPLPQLPEDRIFLNSRYQVNIRMGEAAPPFGLFIQLSIKTRDKAPFHDWRDFQRIKNELVGPDYEAMELYPSEKRLVDTANQYYMFVFPEIQFTNNWFPFGFAERLVAEDITVRGLSGSKQRPFEVKPHDLETSESFQKRIDEMIKNRKAHARAENSAIPNREVEGVAGQGDRIGEGASEEER